MKTHHHFLFLLCCMTVFLSCTRHIDAAETVNVSLPSGDEIVVEHYPTSGKYLMLWFAPEYGLRNTHRSLAQAISEQKIEVWMTNLVESLFLPNGTASIRQLDGSHVADLIEYAHKTTGKKIILAGDSYATIIALTGAHRWQEQHAGSDYLVGAILFTPYTYASIPKLGQLPEYLPIVSATNIPLMIYQAQASPVIGQFETLLEKLRAHGSPVYTRFMPNIMSLFYVQPPTPYMAEQVKPISVHVRKMVEVLARHKFPGTAIPTKQNNAQESGIDIHLKEFGGMFKPLAIALPGINGETFSKQDYEGQVTIINFWATWCPPCIEEIPSLNRLKQKMKDVPFEIISINYAEDKKAVLEFMKKIPIDFPVLLDQDGEFASKWHVISYPSTFVIDGKGRIRYGVNAAIEWDNPELVRKLRSLL